MIPRMTDNNHLNQSAQRIAGLIERGDADGLRAALLALVERPGAAQRLRALDAAGQLTRVIPELEPARDTDQPIVHFLPVLAHSFETVAAIEWLLGQMQAPRGDDGREPVVGQQAIDIPQPETPVAVQSHLGLRYRSVYAEELRRHFGGAVGRYPRAALLKLAALLHDVAKPQTKQPKPGGGVSFHEHQTIGGEIAARVARRLGFRSEETDYIRTVVREHMRPGQLAVLDEVTLRAVRRFFRATGEAGPDVLVHMLADHMATRGPLIDAGAWLAQARWVDALLDTVWGEEQPITPALLNGEDLIRELGITPGPLLGQLLAVVGEAQAGGEIVTRAEAIDLARRTFERLDV